MHKGTLENVATIICFSILLGYTQNYLLFMPMFALVIWFSGIGM